MIPVNTSEPERIGAALTRAFSDLGPVPGVRVLKDGFRNVVVETPGGQVFKIAKSWEASATFHKEVRCLPAVAEHLPVPTPYPRWHLNRSSDFPFGLLGYDKLPGESITSLVSSDDQRQSLSIEVGTSLASLHAIPSDEGWTSALPSPEQFWYELQRERGTILPLLRDELEEWEYDIVAGWWASLMGDSRMRTITPAVIHGDFEPDNLLVSGQPSRLTGIVDFEGLAVGDPAQDLAPLLCLGNSNALAIIDHYHAAGGILDEDFEYRVQRHWELCGFKGMQLAIHYENQREFDRLLARLRKGPLLNDTTRRETQLWPPLQR